LELNKEDVGKIFEVLIEGVSARNNMELYGRNTQNKVIVFPKGDLKPGTYVNVLVTSCTSGTLIGTVVKD
jgi:tRNA-2-methylthio-N6-dimethylallyladenosine synthase